MQVYKEEMMSSKQIKSKTIAWLLSFILLITIIVLGAYMFFRQWNPNKEGTASTIPHQFRPVDQNLSKI